MTDSLTEAKKMQEMFLKYFHSTLSINLIILIIYVLFVCVAILKYSLKGIIASVIGITLAYTAYLLVYDVTYIQYLMSLRLDEGFRLLVAQYLPLFSLSKHAPSKALPRIDLKQANILKMKFNVSFIMNAYYEYNRIKTVYSIHNIQYQGIFPMDLMNILFMPYSNSLEFKAAK